MSDRMPIDVFARKGVRIVYMPGDDGRGWLGIGDLCIRFPESGLARVMAEAAERFREAGGAEGQEGEG